MSEMVKARAGHVARLSSLLGASILACVVLVHPASADEPDEPGELHPLMTSKFWVKAGGFFAARDLSLSVSGTVGSDPDPETTTVDFDSETGLDDRSDLFIGEFGWQFSKNWDFAFQYFRSSRSSHQELSGDIEWEDVVYEAGARVDVHSYMKIARFFFSRAVWDKGHHDFRLGAGLHLIDTGASISGEATLEDMSTEFQASIVSAKFPFPDIGAWYRYSRSERWVFNARADWLSASIGDYSGGIWNVQAGVDFAITNNLGIGLAYQFFELNGTLEEESWNGELNTRYEGVTLTLDGYW